MPWQIHGKPQDFGNGVDKFSLDFLNKSACFLKKQKQAQNFLWLELRYLSPYLLEIKSVCLVRETLDIPMPLRHYDDPSLKKTQGRMAAECDSRRKVQILS